jgi:transposase-like protein
VPQDREGSLEPLLIPKHERHFTGFDDKIVAMYVRGTTLREIQGLVLEQYGTEVSPDFISSVTDEVMAEVTAWQARPLEPMYPVVFFDTLRVKIREDAVVRNKAVYLALGILPDRTRDVLGLWIENADGAKYWMKVFNDLKTRGVAVILISVADGLKCMPEALAAVFPAATLQTCIVHLIRNSLDYASWKDRRSLADAIRPIYTAPSAEATQAELGAFTAGPWGQEFLPVSAAWRNAWDRVIHALCIPAGRAQSHLHDERNREHQIAVAQDHQDARPIPDRRRSNETDLAGASQYHGRLGPCRSRLEDSDEPIRYPLCGSIRSAICVNFNPVLNTEILTLPRREPLQLPANPMPSPTQDMSTFDRCRDLYPNAKLTRTVCSKSVSRPMARSSSLMVIRLHCGANAKADIAILGNS